jgi:hypothetical protein
MFCFVIAWMSVNWWARIQSVKWLAMSWMTSVQFLTGVVISFFTTMSRPTLVETQSPTHWVLRIMKPECDNDNSLPSSVEIYVHRGNFTFLFMSSTWGTIIQTFLLISSHIHLALGAAFCFHNGTRSSGEGDLGDALAASESAAKWGRLSERSSPCIPKISATRHNECCQNYYHALYRGMQVSYSVFYMKSWWKQCIHYVWRKKGREKR